MRETEHIIWSNRGLDYEDWKEELESQYPELTEEERVMRMYEINDDYLEDERMNLDISLPQPILVIADIGRWDGRYSGYREIASGNIADCLYSSLDYVTWYVDGRGDLRCTGIHHDGRNHYLYRVYKEGTTEEQRDRLKEKIYEGSAARGDITRVTRRLGDEIGRVYGWEFPKIRAGSARER